MVSDKATPMTVGSVVFEPRMVPDKSSSTGMRQTLVPRAMASAWDDQPLPEDAEIRAAHPVNSGRDDLYMEAMRLVGARRSKGGLVELVTWLLLKAERANGR